MKYITWITLVWSMLTTTAQAASFDCTKAHSKVEHLICDNPDTSKLDDELAASYKAALQNQSKTEAIKLAQKQWLKERNACSDAACVRNTYIKRNEQLQVASSTLAQPAKDVTTEGPKTSLGQSRDLCESPPDASLPTCLESTNYGLQNSYESLISNDDEHDRDILRKEQSDWIKQRNRQCNLVPDKDFLTNEGWVWSIVDDNEKIRFAKSRCVITLTRERIAKLEPQIKTKQEMSVKLIAEYESRRNTPYQPPSIPTEGKTLLDFIPRGYAILEKIEADFNGDQKKDVAMILSTVPEYDIYPRPFLILFTTPEGGYSLSVRNDHVAPTGEGGGIANPNGADALKSKGRSILIEESGGGSSAISGHIGEYSYLNDGWYLISTEEWAMNRQGDADKGICDDDISIKIPAGWICTTRATQTDLRTGQVIDSWTLENKVTHKEHIKKAKHEIEREELKRFDEADSSK